MSLRSSLIVLIQLLLLASAAGQVSVEDRYKKAMKGLLHDTTRCRVLNELIEAETNDTVWPYFNQKLKEIAEKNIYKEGSLKNTFLMYYSTSLNNEGNVLDQRGETEEALKHYHKSLDIKKQIRDEKGVAVCYNNIATLYRNMGQLSLALDFNHKALSVWKSLNDKPGIASTLNNIGVIYSDQGDIAKAIEYISTSLQLNEQLQLNENVAHSLLLLGDIYDSQGDTATALNYFLRALELQKKENDQSGLAQTKTSLGYHYFQSGNAEKGIREFEESMGLLKSLGDKLGLATIINNLGYIYSNTLNDHHKAAEMFHQALSIREDINDLSGMANSYLCIGEMLLKERKYTEAEKNTEQAFLLSQKVGVPNDIAAAAGQLFLINKQTRNYEKALRYYEIRVKMLDSIQNEDNRKAGIRSQLKYEYEKQAAADSVAHAKETEIKNAELKKQEAEIKAKKNQQYALFGGLALVIVFAGFMFNRWKVTQKQKLIIELQKTEVEEQKKLVEEKQKEIVDSITYSKRIQIAQIPNEKQFATRFKRIKG